MLPALLAQEQDLCKGGGDGANIDREEGGQIPERPDSLTAKSGLSPLRRREQLEPPKQQISIIKGESYRRQFFVGLWDRLGVMRTPKSYYKGRGCL